MNNISFCKLNNSFNRSPSPKQKRSRKPKTRDFRRNRSFGPSYAKGSTSNIELPIVQPIIPAQTESKSEPNPIELLLTKLDSNGGWTDVQIDIFSGQWEYETIKMNEQMRKASQNMHKCSVSEGDCPVCFVKNRQSHLSQYPTRPSNPSHKNTKNPNSNTFPLKSVLFQHTLHKVSSSHHMHDIDYSTNYNPTLNNDSNYTFGRLRNRKESVYENRILFDSENIENESEKINIFVPNGSESLQHYHSRMDDLCSPMKNIFMNHPHFNHDYQRQRNKHVLNIENKGIKRNIDIIPMNCIQIPLVSPQKVTIIAAADTMSDIDCMGINPTLYYRNLGLIHYDEAGVRIATGGGKFTVHCYVPISLKCENGTEITRKFWCLENLPTYDWLIGKHTLPEIGYTATHILRIHP